MRFGEKILSLALGLFALGVSSADPALGATINFDFDALGNPLSAPNVFSQTTRLSEFYAPLGVHFSGPTPSEGGAILDQAAGFGVNARSGSNFLAFNDTGAFASGFRAKGPETITFDRLMQSVSIFVAGGANPITGLPASINPTLEAFDADGLLVASYSTSVSGGLWGYLSVSWSAGIKSVRLADGAVFVADDLAFTEVPQVPEGNTVPTPQTLWGGALLAGVCWGLRRISRK